MKPFRGLFLVVFPVSLLGPSVAAADDAVMEQHFTRTAQQNGSAYQVGRELLERQGKAILPLLKQKQESKDWRERLLARSLLLRVESPDRVAAWRPIFEYGFHKLELANDGTIKIQTGGDPVVLDRSGLPLLLDYIRDAIPDISRGSSSPAVWQRVLTCVGHLADPESVPVLLEAHDFTPSQKSGIPGALVKIGKPAVPLIRDAIRTCPVAMPDTQTEEKRRDWYRMMGSAGLAGVLAQLGDTESAPVLIAKLKEARYYGQVQGYAAALSEMKVAAALPVVWERLLQSAEQTRKQQTGSWDSVHYGEMRQSLVAYGAAARDLLREQTADKQPLGTRVIAAGVRYEIEHADDAAKFYRTVRVDRFGQPEKPAADPVAFGRQVFWNYAVGTARREPVPQPLLLERASVFGMHHDLLRLAQAGKEPLAFDVIEERMLAGRSFDLRSHELLIALAESGNEKVLDLASKVLDKHLSLPMLTAAIESTLILRSPKGVTLLEEIVRRAPEFKKIGLLGTAEVAALAQAVIPAVKGEADQLVRLLENQRPAIRDAAARQLARKGDLRALPVLVKDAATGGAGHANLRDALVRLGKPATPALEKELKENQNPRVRLLCEAVILHIAKPELVKKFVEAAEYRDPGFDSHAGPTIQTYRGSGTRVARAVGAEGVPLLEAALAFQDEPPHPLTAMFALAHFKQERSIGAIVQAAPQVHDLREVNPVAVVLNQFGEKGIEAAKKIPAPDPDKERFDSRAARHRAGTEALTLAKDEQGIDNILAGLKLPRPDAGPGQDAWAARMLTYLKLAKKYNDKRLIDPALRLVDPNRVEMGLAALEAVAAYDDPRIAPLAADWLGRDEHEWYANRALNVLAQRLQGETVSFLLKRLKDAKKDSEKITLIRALASFAHHPPLADRAKNDAALAAGRKQAMDPLIALLKDPGRSIQESVADALVSWAGGRRQAIMDERATKPLADWVRGGGTPSVAVIEHLTQARTTDAGPALLAAYRAGKGQNAHIARALGLLQYQDALPDLAESLKRNLALGDRAVYGVTEMTALADLGEKGLARLNEVIRTEKALPPRVYAAEIVGSRGHAKAYDDIDALLKEVIDRGPDNPQLTQPVSFTKEDRYAMALRTLSIALSDLDRSRAYAKFALTFIATKDSALRQVLAYQMQQMEQHHPELKNLPLTPPDSPDAKKPK